MTPGLLAELSRLPLFPRSARDLISVAGLEGAALLITAWPGQVWPVPAVVGGGNPAGARRWGQLVEIVGEPAAARIVRWCPGAELFVPNLKEVLWQQAQDAIRADFDRLTLESGYSVREAVFDLGIKYNVSGAAIQRTLKRPDNAPGEVAVQGTLF